MFAKPIKLLVKLDKDGIAPQKAHMEDAAYDLFTPIDFSLLPDDRKVIDLQIHIVIPEGYCGEIISKSGLSSKYGITAVGLIDAGFTGSIQAMIYRHDPDSLEPYQFHAGDKLTQIKICKIPETELVYCSDLPETDRGDSGFGASGR